MGRLISSRRGAELSIAGATIAVDMLTANNTIAILAVGPLAKSISYRYGIEPKRSASILDTMSCFAQSVIPWGAQLLIAAGLAAINPIDIIPYLYYPFLLGFITLVSIIFYNKKTI
jgi:Na+/H+ antiporter NhaC